mmetsp:Transcript_63141/g.173432  ORF Transcript_63141/g.173432 Transcript_63141/m.173432 type:complete len:292 (-) Transcript_63141:797-1672(-)
MPRRAAPLDKAKTARRAASDPRAFRGPSDSRHQRTATASSCVRYGARRYTPAVSFASRAPHGLSPLTPQPLGQPDLMGDRVVVISARCCVVARLRWAVALGAVVSAIDAQPLDVPEQVVARRPAREAPPPADAGSRPSPRGRPCASGARGRCHSPEARRRRPGGGSPTLRTGGAARRPAPPAAPSGGTRRGTRARRARQSGRLPRAAQRSCTSSAGAAPAAHWQSRARRAWRASRPSSGPSARAPGAAAAPRRRSPRAPSPLFGVPPPPPRAAAAAARGTPRRSRGAASAR